MKRHYFTLILLFTPLFAFGENVDSSLDIVEKVEQNLIYSKEVERSDMGENVIIKKGAWTQEDSQKFQETGLSEKKIVTKVKKQSNDSKSLELKRKAYDAMSVGQYEIAVKLYKDAIKLNKNDTYAVLGLATAYQYLGEYNKAKPLYVKVVEAFPEDQQVMANLLAIVTDETPYEAVYLLSNIADQNRSSALMQAQASIAYAKVNNYPKAIEYIIRAIELDNLNLEYKYNLAVYYDVIKDYTKARSMYNDILFYAMQNQDNQYNIPLREVQERLNVLNEMLGSKTKKKKKK